MVSRILVCIMWPFFLILFIFLNLVRVCLFFTKIKPTGIDIFKIFINIIFLHASLSLIFTFKLLYNYMNIKSMVIILIWTVLLFDLSYILLLSGDIETHPGPQLFNNLKIAYWNVGGLSTDNFAKKTSLEAFIFTNKLDVVMIGESHLKDSISDCDLEISGYTLKRCDHPGNLARGGVCVYYRSDLPISIKTDINFLNECVVMELKVGRKRCFLTCLYRSPAYNTKQEVDNFIGNLEKNLSEVEKKNPYVSIVLGDFNAKNSSW